MDPRTEKLLADRAQKAALLPPPLRPVARTASDLKFRLKGYGVLIKVGAAAAVIALLAAYHVFITRPAERLAQSQLDARTAARIRTDSASRQLAMDDCLSKAAADAEAEWKAACKAHHERAGCALPARQNQELQRKEGEARNSCLMKFSVSAQ